MEEYEKLLDKIYAYPAAYDIYDELISVLINYIIMNNDYVQKEEYEECIIIQNRIKELTSQFGISMSRLTKLKKEEAIYVVETTITELEKTINEDENNN